MFERIGPSLLWTVAIEGRLLHGSQECFDPLRLRAIEACQDSWKVLQATRAYLDRHLG